jgi:hypothetical protein
MRAPRPECQTCWRKHLRSRRTSRCGGIDHRSSNLNDLVQAQVLRRQAVTARYLENDEPARLLGLDDLVQAVAAEKLPGALFAVPQIGPFSLAAALITRSGVKMATVFWNLSGGVKQLLENSDVVLLKLDRNSAPRLTIEKIAELQLGGFCVCLLIEVPMRSRRRYSLWIMM